NRSASARRREELRRNVPRPGPDFLELARRPDFVTTVLVTLGAALAIALTIALSRDLPRAYAGEVAMDSRVNPREYSIENKTATKEARENAEHSAPRFYVANATYLAAIRAAIEVLPVATFEKTDLTSIKPEIVAR